MSEKRMRKFVKVTFTKKFIDGKYAGHDCPSSMSAHSIEEAIQIETDLRGTKKDNLRLDLTSGSNYYVVKVSDHRESAVSDEDLPDEMSSPAGDHCYAPL